MMPNIYIEDYNIDVFHRFVDSLHTVAYTQDECTLVLTIANHHRLHYYRYHYYIAASRELPTDYDVDRDYHESTVDRDR
jgi:hypothetical protein